MLRTLLVSAALAASPVAAQEAVFWKSVGNWDVSIDTTISNGCYAIATWNGGTVLRIGLNPQEENFYLLVGNEKWASLESGQEYDISIKFGAKAAWDVSARGLQFNPGEIVYLHAESTKFEFIEEFMRQSSMKISYQNKEIDTLKLTGSSRAFKEVMACQQEVDKRGTANTSDPFAGSSSRSGSGKKSEDPFASN